MIVTIETMKICEEKSAFTTIELIEEVGFKLAVEIMKRQNRTQRICLVCGTGNNGADGFVCAQVLQREGYDVVVLPIDDKQKTKESKMMRETLSTQLFATFEQVQSMSFDLIVDAIYGCGFHGEFNEEVRKIVQWINESNTTVYAIDVNSGAHADTGSYDKDAVRSQITFALGFLKPFHCLRKDHFLFKEVVCIPLSIETPKKSDVFEMDTQTFLEHTVNSSEDSYKGKTGKALLIGGCMGMAGALAHNILGAKASGCTYLHVACEESIYPILASREITPVFHPFTSNTAKSVIDPLLQEVNAIGFGSGVTYLSEKRQIQECLLQQRSTPIVLDADAIRLLVGNLYLLKFVAAPVILTPHIKEFADLINLSLEEVQADKVTIAQQFAKEYGVYLVLKGPCTLVVSPMGDLYINQTGNQALARAGSGDLLTGLITGFVSQNTNIFLATILGVWLHGKAADLALEKHPLTTMQPEYLMEAIDEFYLNHKR